MSRVTIESGMRAGEDVKFVGLTVTLGRDETNELVVPDEQVSRVHARITRTAAEYRIEDLGSTNGTFVNGDRITARILRFEDEIRLGRIRLTFLADSALETMEGSDKVARAVIAEPGDDLPDLAVRFALKSDLVTPVGLDRVRSGRAALERAYERLGILYEVNHSIGTLSDLPSVLDRMLELVLRITGAERGYVLLMDRESGEPLPQVAHRTTEPSGGAEKIAISRAIIDRVRDTGEALLVSDTQDHAYLSGSESVVLHRIRSAMCVPIQHRAELLGILNVDSASSTEAFSEQDLKLLIAVCREIGLVIANAQMYADLKRAYEQLKRRQAQVVEAERIAALGALAGGIVHEISNPLTGVISFSELIRTGLEAGRTDPESIQQYIRHASTIHREGHRCHKIARDLLHLAKRRKSEREPCDVNELVERALAVARYNMSGSGVEVHTEPGDSLPAVVGDPNQLQQVFLNLILNAKDAMLESGGRLTISTRASEGTWVDAVFADTGHGIPDELKDKVFEPLFTTKGEGKGTGLGLPVSWDLVASHGGVLLLETELDRGTTFTVRLPIGSPPVES